MENERLNIQGWWAMIRWFMVTVLFSIGMLHISFGDRAIESVVFLGVFAGIVGLNLMYHLQIRINQQMLLVMQVMFDLIFATMVVHLTGGLSSYFVWIYVIAVITASLGIPRFGGVMAGLMGSLFLLVLIVLYRNGVMVPNDANTPDVTGASIYILSYTGLFCGVAFIATFLSDQLKLYKNTQATVESLGDEISSLKSLVEEHKEFKREVDDLVSALQDIARLDHDINTPLCVISLSISRVKKLGTETNDESLLKTGSEVTEAVNRISELLLRLDKIKTHKLVDYKRGGI